MKQQKVLIIFAMFMASSCSFAATNTGCNADSLSEQDVVERQTKWYKGSKLGRFVKKIDEWFDKGMRAGIDTTYQDAPELSRQVYIGTYFYGQKYTMSLPVGLPEAKTATYNIKGQTFQGEMNLGIDYKGLALELPLPMRSDYEWSTGLAKNGSVWGFRIRYKRIKKMNFVHSATYDEGGETPQLGGLALNPSSPSVSLFMAEGYYIINHKKFSLAAGLYADMVQKKSAGGFFVYANYYQTRFSVNNLLFDNFDSFRTQQVSIGGGYGYNLAFMQGKLVLHASAVPMLTFYNNLVHKTRSSESSAELQKLVYEGEPRDFYYAANHNTGRFRVNAFARFAANYRFDRYIVTFLFNYRYWGFSNAKELRINNHDGDAQLNFCVCF